MLSRFKTTPALIVALFVCFQLAFSQQTEAAKTETEAAMREKAVAALESLADQLGSLQSPENRARIGANIADSLWRHDERRARSLFQLVHEDIKLGLQTRPRDPQSTQTFEVFLKLRTDTQRRIAKYDAELALALFRDASPVVKESATLPHFSEEVLEARERAFEVELTKALARQNPEAAIAVARKSLTRGFEEGLLPLLVQLGGKNKEQARFLYRDIVSKLATTDFKRHEEAIYFASQLAKSFPPPAADDATFRNLLEIILTQALASGCDKRDAYSHVCYSIGSVVSQLELYFPTRASRLRRWTEFNEGGSVANSEAQFQMNEIRENGTVEELLALVAKYPEMEDEIAMDAMRKAESAGDFERAKRIADDYRGNPQTRQRMQERASIYLLEAERTATAFAMVQEQIADASAEEQIAHLLNFANHTAPHARETALKALALAKPKVDSLKPGPEQIRNQIMIATIYCAAQSDRGFAMVEAMLPVLNELVSAAAKLDRFDTSYLRDGEWNMSAHGEVGKVLTLLSDHAAYFAWYDFERAMNLAAQFERTELRMMAQLKVAQGILAGRRKRLSRSSAPN